jgi:hypothetical protein
MADLRSGAHRGCGEVSVDAGEVFCTTITYTNTLPPDSGVPGHEEVIDIISGEEFRAEGRGGGPPCGEGQPVPGTCELDVLGQAQSFSLTLTASVALAPP